MFEDSLIESGNRFKAKRRLSTTILSFVLQVLLIGILILIPLIYTDALPKTQLMTFLVAPPPPPPPPPPPAAAPVKVVKMVSEVVNGQLRTPTKIPEKVQMIKEEEAPPDLGSGGVPGGVPGGIPGGSAGGVIGGIISSTHGRCPESRDSAARPRFVGRVDRSFDQEGYAQLSALAKQARIQGQVVLQAEISKDGTIQNLQLISGHPMLAPAAIEAVKQWRYKPYLLNGEPVAVETQVM
jgi:periplasmic protein TonB